MTQENTHHGSILNPRTLKTNKQKDRNTKAPEKRGSASLYNLKKIYNKYITLWLKAYVYIKIDLLSQLPIMNSRLK